MNEIILSEINSNTISVKSLNGMNLHEKFIIAINNGDIWFLKRRQGYTVVEDKYSWFRLAPVMPSIYNEQVDGHSSIYHAIENMKRQGMSIKVYLLNSSSELKKIL